MKLQTYRAKNKRRTRNYREDCRARISIKQEGADRSK
jgi:hypothetical protein